jgi:hypothetical protein
MAKVVKNEKGFKVIEVSLIETTQWGGLGICDNCNNPAFKGYYVAVLNHLLCEDCYKDWCKYAIYYPEDNRIEERNFERYKKILNIE